MTALDNVLLAAQLAGGDEDEAAGHLHGECGWFRAVSDGAGAADVQSFCKPAKGGGTVPRLVVKLSSPAQTLSGSQTASGRAEGGQVQVQGGSQGISGRVALTPDTPEASTVPEPTVPPGGPGLFHVKGMQLPPYIQHLWHHLAPKYGKHRAYGMAVGIVKKWAQGVNPGGWNTKSGKGKRTHPDVRAAAARNVAMWEADRARAHAQSAKREAGHHG